MARERSEHISDPFCLPSLLSLRRVNFPKETAGLAVGIFENRLLPANDSFVLNFFTTRTR